MNEWTCTIPGRPTTKGNSRRIFRAGGRPFTASSPQAIAAENNARAVAFAMRPVAPLVGPLRLDVHFVFAIPQAARERVSKRGKVTPAKLCPGEPCMRRIDRGNLLKLIEDALEGIVYDNDSQIVGGDVAKVWGERDETRVSVRALMG
ncbi:MAG: RusA family crossover junction endodeoxyribonuclease [Planctomycetes bacterium]|nr:RusA family crossover junction endodeoxyribonuclease [Planctomycetota bacterium]